MDSLTPLALLGALASGFITITFLAAGRRGRAFRHAGAFIYSLLLYNLLVILGLAWALIRTGPLRSVSARTGFIVLVAALLTLACLKIAWIHSLIVIRGRVLDRPVRRRAGKYFFFLGALVTILSAAAVALPGSGLVEVFGRLEYAFLIAVMGIGASLAAGAARRPRGPVRKATAVLGLSIFLLFAAALAGLVLEQGRASRDSGIAGPVNALGLVLFNLVIWLWVRANAGAFPVVNGAEFNAPPLLVARYGLTMREIEIISLVCRGKSNKDIADELCISPQTVKDHNYNIFRKTGVRNRTQLARLFML